MENPPLVPGIRYSYQSSSYPRQIQHIGRPSIEARQATQNRMGFGSVGSKLHLPNAQFTQCGFVCDNHNHNHKLPLYVSPVADNHALATDALSMGLNCLHAYAFPLTILIPSVLSKIRQSQCRIILIAPLWPSTSVVLRGVTTISISSNSSSTLSKTTDTSKGKVYSSFTLGSYQTIN